MKIMKIYKFLGFQICNLLLSNYCACFCFTFSLYIAVYIWSKEKRNTGEGPSRNQKPKIQFRPKLLLIIRYPNNPWTNRLRKHDRSSNLQRTRRTTMMMGLSMIVYTFQNSLTIVLSKINKFNIIYTKTNYFKNNNHRLPMHMFSFSINSKTLLLTIISLLTVLQMCSCKKTITPYLLEDEYFDRIFKISDDSTMK